MNTEGKSQSLFAKAACENKMRNHNIHFIHDYFNLAKEPIMTKATASLYVVKHSKDICTSSEVRAYQCGLFAVINPSLSGKVG